MPGDSEDTLDGSTPVCRLASSERLALVVAWSTTEPERMGELALLSDGEQRLLGRGEARDPGVSQMRLRSFADAAFDDPPAPILAELPPLALTPSSSRLLTASA